MPVAARTDRSGDPAGEPCDVRRLRHGSPPGTGGCCGIETVRRGRPAMIRALLRLCDILALLARGTRVVFAYLAPIRVPVFIVIVGIVLTTLFAQIKELFVVGVAG